MDSVLLFASVSPVGEYWSALDSEAFACAGCVSDAHRDPCLYPEEPCRSLLGDVLDWNAVRECVVMWLEWTGPQDAAAGVRRSSRVRE